MSIRSCRKTISSSGGGDQQSRTTVGRLLGGAMLLAAGVGIYLGRQRFKAER